MKTLKNLFAISIVLFLFSCEKYDKHEVASYFYPDSVPEVEYFYKAYGNTFLLAKEIRHFSDGTVRMEGKYDKNEKKTGKWEYFFETGKRWRIETYFNGKKNGKTIEWYLKGNKMYEGYYKNDLPDGKWQIWNEDGSNAGKIIYKDGKVFKQ